MQLVAKPTTTDEALPTLLTCRTQNQHWAATLRHNEAEIDGLLSLFDDLKDRPNPQGLHYRLMSYYTSLSRLKNRIDQLRELYLCGCTSCGSVPCQDPQYNRYQALTGTFAQLGEELTRLREICYQFLSGLVRLNLI